MCRIVTSDDIFGGPRPGRSPAKPPPETTVLVAVTPPGGNTRAFRNWIVDRAWSSLQWVRLEWRDIESEKAGLYGAPRED